MLHVEKSWQIDHRIVQINLQIYTTSRYQYNQVTIMVWALIASVLSFLSPVSHYRLSTKKKKKKNKKKKRKEPANVSGIGTVDQHWRLCHLFYHLFLWWKVFQLHHWKWTKSLTTGFYSMKAKVQFSESVAPCQSINVTVFNKLERKHCWSIKQIKLPASSD